MSSKPRSGWQIWYPEWDEATDAEPWEGYFVTAAEVAKEVYYWQNFGEGGGYSVEVAVISPEGDTTFWDVYEVCTVKVQQVEGKT